MDKSMCCVVRIAVVTVLVWLAGGGLAFSGDFQLVLAGSCPGEEIVTIASATPGGSVTVLRGRSEGTSLIPGGPCAGTEVGLADPHLLADVTADANGGFTVTTTPPAGACGLLLQAVDLTTCKVGNVGRLVSGYPASLPRTGQTGCWSASPLQRGNRVMTVHAPPDIAGEYAAENALWPPQLDEIGVTGEVELVDDGSPAGSEGCGPLVEFTEGKIALIDRGTCFFDLKVLNAETAGAIAAIIANNQGDSPCGMLPGDDADQLTIPSVCIGQSDGNTLKSRLAEGVSLTVAAPDLRIDCAGTGQDGELRNGVAWPDPRFTDSGDGTVTDNLTGLIWLQDADCFGKGPWADAVADASGVSDGACGLSDGSVAGDWRLPNLRELLSLVDHGRGFPALSEGHPFSHVRRSSYWTSTVNQNSPANSWALELGVSGKLFGSQDEWFLWPVRGGQEGGGAGSPEDFQLVLSGSCPGEEIVTIAGATPDGSVRVLRGSTTGAAIIPAGPCAGTETGLEDPHLLADVTADASGGFTVTTTPRAEACGLLLQAVDITTCEVGNVGRLVSGYPVSVPRTGQTASETPGDDGDLGKGAAWPDPRFIDHGNGTVTDNLTGLVWLKNANCSGVWMDWEGSLTAANGLADGACGLSDGSSAGDWRVPNMREIRSLLDNSQEDLALPSGHPFIGFEPNGNFYWTSTSRREDPGEAWFVAVDYGYFQTLGKDFGWLVWPVRDRE